MPQEIEKINIEKPNKIGENWRNENGTFKEGHPDLGAGRKKGGISPITKIRQIFEEEPKAFEQFVKEYMEDPANRRHLVEMLDGKPRQPIDIQAQIEEKQIRELVLTTRKILELKEINEEK